MRNPFKREKLNRENIDFAKTMLYAQQSKSDSVVEFDKVLGVNRELLHDPYLEGFLEQMCWRWGGIYDKDGTLTS